MFHTKFKHCIPHFKLTDEEIRYLLQGNSSLAGVTLETHGTFKNLQEPAIVRAYYIKDYKFAEHSLMALPAPLSHQDAMVACLCALDGPIEAMKLLLDHCPPIPEFQFQGVGTVSSLLQVAVDYNKHDMLELLLARGADPNAGPTPETACSPLETAFCGNKQLCLKHLLKAETLHPDLTEKMLFHWGTLQRKMKSDRYFDNLFWQKQLSADWLPENARLLAERLAGVPVSPDDPLPIPPQLRIEHALEHCNYELAAHLCQTRLLTDAEKDTVLTYYANCSEHALEAYRPGPIIIDDPNLGCDAVDFLLQFLQQFPETLNHPAIRFAVAVTTVQLNKPDSRLQIWADRLEDGPIYLKKLPFLNLIPSHYDWYKGFFHTLKNSFFLHWRERLGSRLFPVYPVDSHVPASQPSSSTDLSLLFEFAAFTGQRPQDTVSSVANYALQYAPVEFLPKLMQPGELLAEEAPHALIHAARSLPEHRRNQILPYIHKEIFYDL